MTPAEIIEVYHILDDVNALLFYRFSLKQSISPERSEEDKLTVDIHNSEGLIYSGTPACVGRYSDFDKTHKESCTSIVTWIKRSFDNVEHVKLNFESKCLVNGRINVFLKVSATLFDLDSDTIDELVYNCVNYDYINDSKHQKVLITNIDVILNNQQNSYIKTDDVVIFEFNKDVES